MMGVFVYGLVFIGLIVMGVVVVFGVFMFWLLYWKIILLVILGVVVVVVCLLLYLDFWLIGIVVMIGYFSYIVVDGCIVVGVFVLWFLWIQGKCWWNICLFNGEVVFGFMEEKGFVIGVVIVFNVLFILFNM